MKLHEIGQQIKILRETKRLTQEQLASKCGISRVTLGKIERGSWEILLSKLWILYLLVWFGNGFQNY